VGDNFEVIVDVQATASEADGLAAAVLHWLGQEGIVAVTATHCLLGLDEYGYAPGARHSVALDDPSDDYALRHAVNGLEIELGRRVFHPVQGEIGPIECPHCLTRILLEDAAGNLTDHWEALEMALTDWVRGGPGRTGCPACGQPIGVNDWHWPGQWPFAVGFLGFRFWNWPSLSSTFIAAVRQRLGHRVVVTRGHL
jgi:uncharacterized protein (UPF0212 family)